MKAFPHLLALLLFGAQLYAVDKSPKDPDQAATENLKLAKQLFEEAKNHAEQAAKSAKEDADLLTRFAQLTFEEAEWVQRSGEAFEKKQLRLAERYQEKARELCEKRGKLGDKIAAIYQKECDKASKKGDEKDSSHAKQDRLAEIEKKEAELAAEKKLLLNKD